MSLHPEKLPVATLEHIDALCNEFENAWQREGPVPIEPVLTGVHDPMERSALLSELLAL